MLSFDISPNNQNQPLSILFLGAHCDDIEIGCGGTILELANKYKNISIYWVIFSSNSTRAMEARKSAEFYLADVSQKIIIINNFKNGFFPYIGSEIKEYFEQLKYQLPPPDIIFTHFRDDLHQDHRLISELTWNTFRNHLILEYEIPKYDADMKQAYFFVPVSTDTMQKKIQHLNDCFISEKDKQWFTDETFRSIMRLRGVESNSPTGYAEGFHCRKIVWNLS